MKVGTKFKIGYKAKKYNDEFIWREGIWTDECKMWTDKSGQAIFTYYDLDANDYRTAKDYTIIFDQEDKRVQ